MTPMHKRIAIAAAVVVLVSLWLWHRGAERQCRLCFENLAQAIAQGDAPDVLAQVHHDYDFRRQWPTAYASLGEGEARALAARALFVLFQMHRDDPLSLAVDIQELKALPDGRWEAQATLMLSAQGGVSFQLGDMHRHRFVLARDGLSAMRIIDHDPIAFER